MVDLSTTTPARALGTGQFAPHGEAVGAVRQAFGVMTYALQALVAAYQAEEQALSCDADPDLDPYAISHAHDALDLAALDVIALEPCLPSDRSLQMAAFMVRLGINMEDPFDRHAIQAMVSEARLRLVLSPQEADAPQVNPTLRRSFALLDQLAVLVDADDLLPQDEEDTSPAPDDAFAPVF